MVHSLISLHPLGDQHRLPLFVVFRINESEAEIIFPAAWLCQILGSVLVRLLWCLEKHGQQQVSTSYTCLFSRNISAKAKSWWERAKLCCVKSPSSQHCTFNSTWSNYPLLFFFFLLFIVLCFKCEKFTLQKYAPAYFRHSALIHVVFFCSIILH